MNESSSTFNYNLYSDKQIFIPILKPDARNKKNLTNFKVICFELIRSDREHSTESTWNLIHKMRLLKIIPIFCILNYYLLLINSNICLFIQKLVCAKYYDKSP